MNTRGCHWDKTVTVNKTIAHSFGDNYHTIQGALNYFKYKSVYNCRIEVAPGAYGKFVVEDIVTGENPNNLVIEGDTRDLAGFSYFSNFAVAHPTGNRQAYANLGTPGDPVTFTGLNGTDVINVTNPGMVDFDTAGLVAGDYIHIFDDAHGFHMCEVLTPGVNSITFTAPVPALVLNSENAKLVVNPNRLLFSMALGDLIIIRSACTLRGFTVLATGFDNGIIVQCCPFLMNNLIVTGATCGIHLEGVCCQQRTGALSVTLVNNTTDLSISNKSQIWLNNLHAGSVIIDSDSMLACTDSFFHSFQTAVGVLCERSIFVGNSCFVTNADVDRTGVQNISGHIVMEDSVIELGAQLRTTAGFFSGGTCSFTDCTIQRAARGVDVHNGTSVTMITPTYLALTQAFRCDKLSSISTPDTGVYLTPTAVVSSVVHNISGYDVLTTFTLIEITTPVTLGLSDPITYQLAEFNVDGVVTGGGVDIMVSGDFCNDTPDVGVGSAAGGGDGEVTGDECCYMPSYRMDAISLPPERFVKITQTSQRFFLLPGQRSTSRLKILLGARMI